MNNDIDVSKCKYYRPFYFIEDTGIEHYCDDSYLTCTGSDDCYYQKLQIEIQQKEKYKNCLKKNKSKGSPRERRRTLRMDCRNNRKCRCVIARCEYKYCKYCVKPTFNEYGKFLYGNCKKKRGDVFYKYCYDNELRSYHINY